MAGTLHLLSMGRRFGIRHQDLPRETAQDPGGRQWAELSEKAERFREVGQPEPPEIARLTFAVSAWVVYPDPQTPK